MNGVSPQRPPVLSDLRTWGIAYQDASQGVLGHILLSKEDGQRVTLNPAWKLVGGYQVGPQGAGRMFALLPLEMLVDLRSWEGRPSSLLRFSDLSEADFRELGRKVLQCLELAESMRTQIQGQRSGVLLAPAGTKLPPLRGL